MSPNVKLQRLLKIIEQLRTGQTINAEDLARSCDVSVRTIYRDLELLQQSGLEIQYDDVSQGYRLLTSRFVLPANFSLSEALSLILIGTVGRTQSDQTGIPFLDDAQSAAFKILNQLPHKLRTELTPLVTAHEIHIGAINPLDNAAETFQIIQQSIKDGLQLSIVYGSLFEGKTIKTKLSPYRVFFAARSWYIVGNSSLHKEVRTFNLARFHSLTPTKTRYTIPPRFSLEKYFGNAWSMIKGETRYHVVIEFEPKVAQNVAEVQWHKTQKVTRLDNGRIRYEVNVDGIDEITWWILGYGSQAHVIEPEELRERIHQHAREVLTQGESR